MNLIADSENTYKEAVQLAEQLFGKLDIKVASALADMADFYSAQGRFIEARECDARIAEILEHWYGGYLRADEEQESTTYCQITQQRTGDLINSTLRSKL
jgi:hypothetical protein